MWRTTKELFFGLRLCERFYLAGTNKHWILVMTSLLSGGSEMEYIIIDAFWYQRKNEPTPVDCVFIVFLPLLWLKLLIMNLR